jgi:hypothetical protein
LRSATLRDAPIRMKIAADARSTVGHWRDR